MYLDSNFQPTGHYDRTESVECVRCGFKDTRSMTY
jgi:hypothetical protein